MAEKLEGKRFQFTLLEQQPTGVSVAEVMGTANSATRLTFFIEMPGLVPAPAGRPPVQAESHAS